MGTRIAHLHSVPRRKGLLTARTKPTPNKKTAVQPLPKIGQPTKPIGLLLGSGPEVPVDSPQSNKQLITRL